MRVSRRYSVTIHGLQTRRRFLQGLGALAISGICPSRVFAIGKRSLLRIPTLIYDGAYDERLGAQGRLAWELAKRTSIEVDLEHPALDLADKKLFDFPLLYMSGSREFGQWSESERARLRRFLLFGGFLFIDGNPAAGNGFDTSIRREMSEVFPDRKLQTLDAGHTLFKSFYLLDGRWGRLQSKSYLEGVSAEERTMVVYSQNDLGGAWLRDSFGNWRLPVVPGGDRQREMAFRLGINIVMYALCTNYKSDQVHVPFILKRRRK